MPAFDSRDLIIAALLLLILALAIYGRSRTRHAEPGPVEPDELIPFDPIPGQTGPQFLDAIIHTPAQSALSPREREVAALAAQGKSNRQIAGALRMSVSTVQNHMRRIFQKLQIASRTELVWWWGQQGSGEGNADEPSAS